MTPRVIARDWKDKGRWPNWVVQLILEKLVNRTPPSCIAANTVSVISAIHPYMVNEIIKDLPGVSFMRECQTTLRLVTKTLAAAEVSKQPRIYHLFQMEPNGGIRK